MADEMGHWVQLHTSAVKAALLYTNATDPIPRVSASDLQPPARAHRLVTGRTLPHTLGGTRPL